MVTRAYAEGGLSRRFRLKRFERLCALIDTIIEERGACRIVDLGGSRHYWDIVSDYVAGRPLEITLVNPKETQIPAGKFAYLAADAADAAALDGLRFDLVHSNSTIEHVGEWARMSVFAANVRRLAPRYYLQTPYFWFPYEPHFRAPMLHWLPEQLRYRLVMTFALGFAEEKDNVADAMIRVQSARLLDKGQLQALFPDAEVFEERFCGLTKSLIAVRH